MSAPDSTAPGANGPPTFVTTYWSMVLAVGEESPAASALLDELCRTYWYPLYAYVRRKGHDVHDAQDLTQEFFARLLRGNSLREVAPEKGKFRSFLLAAMNHFLAKEWRRETAQKRGGGQVVFSFVAADAEGRYQLDPVDPPDAGEGLRAPLGHDAVSMPVPCHHSPETGR
jgi:DNA-directed RNA polymerase specialized sigma24 family protein